jgi:tRNA dimethylallyltransferase
MTGTIIIGGPTGSGKSTLALALAEAVDGAIINADSMQLYRDLRILTARPDAADQARVPHHLFGILPAEQPCSVGKWLALAEQAVQAVHAQNRVPIVVGGTGLYLHALLHGIAPVPDVPAAIRQDTTLTFRRLGVPGFHTHLAKRDPAIAARLHPSDRQRLIRAAEVLAATGQSITMWQAQPPRRIALPGPVYGIALLPPRAELHARIERRLHRMLDAGALDELEALRARRLDPELPLMKAVTVPEFLAHLEGRLDLRPALAVALAKSRQYAKRQTTWLRHQLPELQPRADFGEILSAFPQALLPWPDVLTERGFTHTVRPAP